MVLSLEDMSGFGAVLHIAGSVLIVYGQTIVKVAHCIEESSGVGSTWLIPPGVHHHPQWYVFCKDLIIAQYIEESIDFKHNFLQITSLLPPPTPRPLFYFIITKFVPTHPPNPFLSIQAPSRW